MLRVTQVPCQVVVTALAATVLTVLAVPAAQGVTASTGRRAGPSTAITWSARKGPVAGALTTTSPAQTSVAFPGSGKTPAELLFWTGLASGHHQSAISYQRAISVNQDKWSPAKTVAGGKAVTDRGPSVASFTSGSARDVIVAWKGSGSTGKIWYSIGIAEQGDVLAWGPAFTAPGALTSDSPAVFSPKHAHGILLTWKVAGGSGIDYRIGSPAGAGQLKWGPAGVLPKARTSSGPAVAEASAGPAKGRIYVLWRTAGGPPGSSGRISYATTPDPLPTVPRWTAPVSLGAGITTSATPSAQAAGNNASWPLLIVYRREPMLAYVTMTESGSLSNQQAVPSLFTSQAPSLSASILVVSDHLHEYYVRVCSGCSRRH